MNLKKGLIIVMAITLLTGTASLFSGCSVDVIPNDCMTIIWQTGLTSYPSADSLISDAQKEVTRETAVSEIIRFSGNLSLKGIENEEIEKQLNYIKNEPSDPANREAIAIAVKNKFAYRENGKYDLQEKISGAEIAYLLLRIADVDDITIENAPKLYKSHFKNVNGTHSCADKATVTKEALYNFIYSMLTATDSNGEQIGTRIVLDKSVSEEKAFSLGIADNLYAERIENALKEIDSTEKSGIVGITLATDRAEKLELLCSYAGENASGKVRNAVSKAKKTISNVKKAAEKLLSITKTATSGITSGLTVNDRTVPESKIVPTAPTAEKTEKKVILQNAYAKYTFTLSPFALTGYYNYETKSEMIVEAAPIFEFKYNGINYTSADCTLISAKISESNGAKTATFTFGLEKNKIKPVLTVTMDETSETRFSFEIINNTDAEIVLTPNFPNLGNMKIGSDAADDWYMYPRKGGIISKRRVTLNNSGSLVSTYGGGVTFPVIDLYDEKGGGSYMMLENGFDIVKNLFFVKDQNGAKINVAYFERNIAPGESFVASDAVVGSHAGDWYASITAYKKYLSTWYDFKAASPALEDNVQFKQVFVQQNVDNKELASDTKKPSELIEGIFDQGKTFGGYSTLHWFDWWDNLGDYNYSSGYGGKAEVRNVADKVHKLGKSFSMYTEGILANTYSNVYLNYGEEIYRLTKSGKRQNTDESFSVTCHKSLYGDLYVNRIAKIASEMPLDIIYLDQFGNQTSSECYNPKHDHTDHYCVLAGQIEILEKLRTKLDGIRKGIAVGGEYPMSDFASQYTSYVFNYNNSMWFTGLDGIAVKPTADLYTFIFPNVKLYNITIRANPNASYDKDNNAASAYIEDLDSLKLVFFNGEGRWHDEGYTGWNDEQKQFTEKSMRAIDAFEDVFMSDTKTPLLLTDNEEVYVNKFENDGTVIWTVLNKSTKNVGNITFTLDDASNYNFFELLEEKQLDYSIDGNRVTVAVNVAADDVVGIAAIKK